MLGGTSMPPDAPLEFVLSGSVGQVSMDGEAKVVDLETLQTVPVNTEVSLKSIQQISPTQFNLFYLIL